MIKRNESDVGDVVFEILAKTVFKFLFSIDKSFNQISKCNGVCIKMKYFKVMIKWCKKIEI